MKDSKKYNNSNKISQCPWGEWEILATSPIYQIKKITVNPDHRLSYQTHAKRKEHWMVVEGSAEVTLDGEKSKLDTGQSIDIPMGAAHRVANLAKGPLVFIEIQTGTYFGEDDIVRLEDDYNRS